MMRCNVWHSPRVGQTLSMAAPDNLQLQWLREDASDARVHVISGAVRHQVSGTPSGSRCCAKLWHQRLFLTAVPICLRCMDGIDLASATLCSTRQRWRMSGAPSSAAWGHRARQTAAMCCARRRLSPPTPRWLRRPRSWWRLAATRSSLSPSSTMVPCPGLCACRLHIPQRRISLVDSRACMSAMKFLKSDVMLLR